MFGVTPSVEIGTSFQQNGTTFRPYLKAGFSFLNDDDLTIQAIIGDPATPFAAINSTHEFGKTSASLEAGLTVLTTKGIDLKLNYEATFSDDTMSHSGGIKASFKF